jgi:hypothetical protein
MALAPVLTEDQIKQAIKRYEDEIVMMNNGASMSEIVLKYGSASGSIEAANEHINRLKSKLHEKQGVISAGMFSNSKTWIVIGVALILIFGFKIGKLQK